MAQPNIGPQVRIERPIPVPHLPDMYDLPSEDPEEPGLPDEFHYQQPQLLRETFQPPAYPLARIYIGTDINLYYHPGHTAWHKRPDWFVVVDHPRQYFNGDLRHSYVVWQEQAMPFCVVELLSPGTEDEDLGGAYRQMRWPTDWPAGRPPPKWMVYEQILKIPYYFVYDREHRQFIAHRLSQGRYRELGLVQERLWLPEIGLGLGPWEGRFNGYPGKWLRWYDAQARWLPTLAEAKEQAHWQAKQANFQAKQARRLAEQEKQRAQAADQRAEAEKRRAQAADQRAEAEKRRAEEEKQRAEEEKQRAEEEKRRADAADQRAAQLAARLRAMGIDPRDDI